MPTRARRRLREHTVGLLARKWTLKIAMALNEDTKRHSEIARCLPGITQKAITSYIPDSKVKEVERSNDGEYSVIEFKETGHYVLPLTLTSVFEQHDPLGYVTGAMTKLSDDEEIILQLVAMPVRLREAEILSHKILGNENILQQVSQRWMLSILLM